MNVWNIKYKSYNRPSCSKTAQQDYASICIEWPIHAHTYSVHILIVDRVPSGMQFLNKNEIFSCHHFQWSQYESTYSDQRPVRFFSRFVSIMHAWLKVNIVLNAYGRLLCKGILSHISFVRWLINAEIAFICHIASILHYCTLNTQTHINRYLPMN